MSQYAKLLEDLNSIPLAKALPADDGKGDEKIQAAAEGGGEGGPKANKEGEGEGGEKQPMAKSMTVTLENGETIEAQDGTELVKSLIARIDANETDSATVMGQAIALIKSQASAIVEQGTLIKSLQADVAKLGNEGKGRKTMLSLVEKPDAGAAPLVKSEQQGLTAPEFLAKSEAAWNSGKITGQEFTAIDVSLRNNVAIDQGLIARVMA